MGASKKIKKILIDRDMTQAQLADAIGKDVQQTKNALYRDTFTYSTLEKWLEAIDCEIVFRDKTTGRLYEQPLSSPGLKESV